MMRFFLCPIILACCGWLAFPASAAAPELPEPDPPGVFRALTSGIDTPANPRCLGDLSQAYCAMETYMACREFAAYRSNPVCAKAGYQPPPPPSGEIKRLNDLRAPDPNRYEVVIRYRLVTAQWLSEAMITAQNQNFPDLVRPGDAILVAHWIRCIRKLTETCFSAIEDVRYFVFIMHHTRDGWGVRINDPPSDFRLLINMLGLPSRPN